MKKLFILIALALALCILPLAAAGGPPPAAPAIASPSYLGGAPEILALAGSIQALTKVMSTSVPLGYLLAFALLALAAAILYSMMAPLPRAATLANTKSGRPQKAATSAKKKRTPRAKPATPPAPGE